MEELLQQLLIMNEHLSTISAYQSLIYDEIKNIKGNGLYNSITDVCDKLDAIKGTGIYDSLADVCDKLDSIESDLITIDSTIMSSSL